MTRIKRDAIAYLGIIGFSLLMLSWAIPTYTPEYPGYGAPADLVPKVAMYVMLFMACLSLLFSALALFMNKPLPKEESEFPEDLKGDAGFTQIGRLNLTHLCRIIIPSVLLVIAIEYIGYALSSFLFLMLLQYVIGNRNWIKSTVLALVLVTVLYVVMRYGFGVPVPGPLLFD